MGKDVLLGILIASVVGVVLLAHANMVIEAWVLCASGFSCGVASGLMYIADAISKKK